VRRRTWLVPLALLGALGLAELGVLVFWPREGVVEPDARRRARLLLPRPARPGADYRGPQLALFLLATAVQLGSSCGWPCGPRGG
jgi:hypothetical protein